MSHSVPHLSAVVVPIRRRGGRVEVFWVKRAETLPFLGGFWAFPGGRVEERDTAQRVKGASGERAALVAAASRELYEEVGVDLFPDTTTFVECGRTVTPDSVPLRYDATYFLAEIPPDQEPDVSRSGGELVDGEWITPEEAEEVWRRSTRLVSPVVRSVMRALSSGGLEDHAKIHAAMQEDGGRRLWELVPAVAMSWLRTPTLPPATHTNCYVVGGRDLVVIDPASPYPEEQRVLDEALDEYAREGRRVREIWLTHHHRDHVSGARHLAERLDVPVCAHRVTARLLDGLVPVRRTLEDGEVRVLPGDRDFPERRLRCVLTPGHAPGHLCFLEEKSKLLITGDMVAGVGTIVIDPAEGDMAQYLSSLERMKTLWPMALLPAHGPIMADSQGKLDEYIQHRLWREARVLDALRARKTVTVAQLVPTVYDDVPKALFPLAERSLLAHLRKLVAESRAAEHPDGSFSAV